MLIAIVVLAWVACVVVLVRQICAKSKLRQENAQRFRQAAYHSVAPTRPWEK
jgi:sensor domain CHASE-containing protein